MCQIEKIRGNDVCVCGTIEGAADCASELDRADDTGFEAVANFGLDVAGGIYDAGYSFAMLGPDVARYVTGTDAYLGERQPWRRIGRNLDLDNWFHFEPAMALVDTANSMFYGGLDMALGHLPYYIVNEALGLNFKYFQRAPGNVRGFVAELTTFAGMLAGGRVAGILRGEPATKFVISDLTGKGGLADGRNDWMRPLKVLLVKQKKDRVQKQVEDIARGVIGKEWMKEIEKRGLLETQEEMGLRPQRGPRFNKKYQVKIYRWNRALKGRISKAIREATMHLIKESAGYVLSISETLLEELRTIFPAEKIGRDMATFLEAVDLCKVIAEKYNGLDAQTMPNIEQLIQDWKGIAALKSSVGDSLPLVGLIKLLLEDRSLETVFCGGPLPQELPGFLTYSIGRTVRDAILAGNELKRSIKNPDISIAQTLELARRHLHFKTDLVMMKRVLNLLSYIYRYNLLYAFLNTETEKVLLKTLQSQGELKFVAWVGNKEPNKVYLIFFEKHRLYSHEDMYRVFTYSYDGYSALYPDPKEIAAAGFITLEDGNFVLSGYSDTLDIWATQPGPDGRSILVKEIIKKLNLDPDKYIVR